MTGFRQSGDPGPPHTAPAGAAERIVTEATEAIEREPSDRRAYFRRGNSYSNMGQYAEAKADFDQVIEMEPGNAMAHNNRGVALLCSGDPRGAIRDTTRAIALDPGYRDAYLNRGLALLGSRESWSGPSRT